MKRRVLLCDYQYDIKNPISKAVTGTFGSKVELSGFFGKLFKRKKKNSVIFPPLYLAYAASIFKKNNWTVEHSYSLNQSNNTNDYDLIIFASSMPDSDKEALAINEFKKYSNSPILVCGAFAKERPQVYLEVADAVVGDGEPENVFELVSSPDYCLKDLKGIIKAGQPNNLDELPFPDWKVFNYKKFKYLPMLKGNALSIVTSRGCPYNCDYCHYMPEAGPNIRFRSIGNIIKEINYLTSELNIKSLIFRDLVFTINRKRTIDLCNAIIDQNLDIAWAIETRIDKLDEELILIMKKAGLRHINLGVESPDESILKNVGRKTATIEKQEKIVKYLHQNNISISAFYILGLTNDTLQSMKATINYSKKLNTLAAQFCVMTPFPGTKLYENLKDKLLTQDWTKFTQFQPTVKLDNITPKELIQYRDLAYRKYYSNPKWFFKHWKKLI